MIDLIYGDDPAETLVDFLRFSLSELRLTNIPKIDLISEFITNSESNSFAAYSPSNKSIVLYVKGRHILDILRSLCHELVHFRQDLNNELTPDSGKTGSPHENEANSLAGQIMRKYGKLHPELF